jgi:hypothetical protein
MTAVNVVPALVQLGLICGIVVCAVFNRTTIAIMLALLLLAKMIFG